MLPVPVGRRIRGHRLSYRTQAGTGSHCRETSFQKYEPKAQLERIRILEERFAARWGKIGSVAELFGKAHASAHDEAGAIRWYELEVNAGDATASVKAAEKLANVRLRSPWTAVKNAQRTISRESSRLKAARARSPRTEKRAPMQIAA
jgi:hypothetical protein